MKVMKVSIMSFSSAPSFQALFWSGVFHYD